MKFDIENSICIVSNFDTVDTHVLRIQYFQNSNKIKSDNSAIYLRSLLKISILRRQNKTAFTQNISFLVKQTFSQKNSTKG